MANAAAGYARYALANPATVPGFEWALWLTGLAWPLVLSQGVFLMLLLVFPTGSLVSPSWRPVAWLVVGWTATSAFVTAFAAGRSTTISTSASPILPGHQVRRA